MAGLGASSCWVVAGTGDFTDEAGGTGAAATGGGTTGGGGQATGGQSTGGGGTGGDEPEGGSGPTCDPAECNGTVEPCGTQSCEDDVCTLSDVPEGTACVGESGVCNLLGECVECVANGDCPNNGDTCSKGECVPASCSNGIIDGGETDLNCGGPNCGPCDPGEMCLVDGDCTTGNCPNGSLLCTATPSCQALKGVSSLGSGVYVLDPGGPIPFEAYCDMETDGGGWTLAMKLTSGNTFTYSSSLWTNLLPFNEDDLTPNTAAPGDDAKLLAYLGVTGNEMRLEWLQPTVDFHYDGLAGQTLQELFSGGLVEIVGNENTACHGPLLDASPDYDGNLMRFGEGAQLYAINYTKNTNTANMRWGFGSNDDSQFNLKSQIAIGRADQTIQWGGQLSCDDGSANYCGCYGNLHQEATTAANLWVR